MIRLQTTIALLAGLFLVLASSASTAASLRATRGGLDAEQAFLYARDAFRAGDAVKLARSAEAMQAAGGHVLEPWVVYWQLRLRLEDRTPEEIRWFLTRNSGSLLAEQLRRDWLKVLGKRRDWARYNEEAPQVVGEDPELTCYGLLSRASAGDTSAFSELKPLWLTAKELPEGCVPLADNLIGSGQWSATQVWERFRVLVEANHLASARRVLNMLPRGESPELKLLDKAIGSPQPVIERPVADLGTRIKRELYLASVIRISRDDPSRAYSHWDRSLRARYPAEDQAYMLGVIATAAAKRHMPDALSWFAEIDPVDAPAASRLSDEQLAWRVRIALRQDNWREVMAAIARMSPAGRADPTWVYWQGRALKAEARTPEERAAAQELFARIAAEHHFYGRLAAEEIGQRVKVDTAVAITPEELASAAANPAMQRALALYRLDMRTEATREWNWMLRGMSDRSLLAAARIARDNEIWDRAINTADRTVAQHDFSVRYLAPYRDVLGNAARARALEEPLVLGLVRQESRFITKAKSSVGASGLMQLMPATAQWVARKMGMTDYSWAKAHEPQTNAALGTFYLRQVLDELDGHPVLAAAAYNAGPGRARRWRDARPLEGAIYAESIPFSETRDYVKKVMANTMYYTTVLGGEFRSLKARLVTISGRSPADGLAALKPDPTP
jgi:soluble lytic murein transglycosylase